jgi:hypothetical protein
MTQSQVPWKDRPNPDEHAIKQFRDGESQKGTT